MSKGPTIRCGSLSVTWGPCNSRVGADRCFWCCLQQNVPMSALAPLTRSARVWMCMVLDGQLACSTAFWFSISWHACKA